MSVYYLIVMGIVEFLRRFTEAEYTYANFDIALMSLWTLVFLFIDYKNWKDDNEIKHMQNQLKNLKRMAGITDVHLSEFEGGLK